LPTVRGRAYFQGCGLVPAVKRHEKYFSFIAKNFLGIQFSPSLLTSILSQGVGVQTGFIAMPSP